MKKQRNMMMQVLNILQRVVKNKFIFTAFLVSVFCSAGLFSFGSGVHLQPRTDFGGSLTMPTVTEERLKAHNPRVVGLHGLMSDLLMGVEGTSPLDIFMTVNFLPVINFGSTGKAYFFNNRLAVGLGFYGRMIADMNPFMASVKLLLKYNIPVYKMVAVVLGACARYNIYSPNKL